MGVKLINRDTRKLSLTEAGIHLHKSSAYPLAQLREIENEASNFQTKPAGDLKITLPVEVSIRLLNDISLILSCFIPRLTWKYSLLMSLSISLMMV